MVGAVTSVGSSYRSPYLYQIGRGARQRAESVHAGRVQSRLTAVRAPQIGRPVTPVDPVTPVRDSGFDKEALLNYMAFDPAERAVRSRIQYLNNNAGLNTLENAGNAVRPETPNDPEVAWIQRPGGGEDVLPWNAGAMAGPAAGEDGAEAVTLLPGQRPGDPYTSEIDPDAEPAYAVLLPGQEEAEDAPYTVRLPGQTEEDGPWAALPGQGADEGQAADEADRPGVLETETQSAREVMEEEECQTCKRRKYQDGSDDIGVSFQSPTHIDPDMASTMVRGHENEHVVRDRAKAAQEDRKVVSQSVTYHTAICPECGRVYTAGGTTRTVTANQPQPYEPQSVRDAEKEPKRPFFAEI